MTEKGSSNNGADFFFFSSQLKSVADMNKKGGNRSILPVVETTHAIGKSRLLDASGEIVSGSATKMMTTSDFVGATDRNRSTYLLLLPNRLLRLFGPGNSKRKDKRNIFPAKLN